MDENSDICSLNDNCKYTGTFANINKRDGHILFNTLETSPYINPYIKYFNLLFMISQLFLFV